MVSYKERAESDVESGMVSGDESGVESGVKSGVESNVCFRISLVRPIPPGPLPLASTYASHRYTEIRCVLPVRSTTGRFLGPSLRS